jgi:uncharacterized protein YjiS (DUF1127 family)
MTMLLPTQSRTPPSLRRVVLFNAAARLRRFVNGWVANFIVHRERQAVLTALHLLNDRQLKDIGLHRGQIDEAVAKAAQARLGRIRLL